MAGDGFARMLVQAEGSSPGVRAAALMRLARVQSATDREGARATFARGLAQARELSGREREALLDEARLLAAAVAPDLVRALPYTGRVPWHFEAQRIAQTMMAHQHLHEAFTFTMQDAEPGQFPYGTVAGLIERFSDPERRLALLRRAIEAWRAAPNDQFLWMFARLWKVLPAEEAAAVAREIVGVGLEQPDQPTTAQFDPEGSVQMTSSRVVNLFLIFHVLQKLDAALARRLIGEHEQLAAAVRRFPKGMETVAEEGEARRKAAAGNEGKGFMMMGSQRDFPYLRKLMQAREDGDFAPCIEIALERYREDTSVKHPNQAPREFWPSTYSFRGILHSAGVWLGEAAAAYLDAIPDADLRLFAEVEMAAALAGLPELQGTQMSYRPGGGGHFHQLAGPAIRAKDGGRIRCPLCDWEPRVAERWRCKCGHSWNTFETGGVCPECGFAWKTTACNRCRRSSGHAEWYE